MPPDNGELALRPTVDPLHTLRKYFNIFRVSLIERMAYRGDFLLGTVLRFFPMITTILLWQAVFAAAPATGALGDEKEI